MDFIIDGNAYLNVAISVIKNMLYKDKSVGSDYYVDDIFNEGKFILRESVKIQFRNFCLSYLYSIIAPVGKNIDSVHFVFDSKSWRKEYIKDFFKADVFDSNSAPSEFTYKGNRKGDDKIHLFFEYFQDIIIPALIKEAHINYYRVPDTEGDDIIAYLCEVIKNDIIVYTVDGDIKQLTYSSGKNIIVIYPKQTSNHKKVCVPQKWNPEPADEEVDNFFSLSEIHIAKPSVTKAVDIFKEKDYVEYIIDPVNEIFTKIFRGDKKDNIPKMDKMTPIKTNKLIENIKSEYGSYAINLLDKKDDAFINFIIRNISILNKVTDIDVLKDIRKHLIFNTKIIRLNSSLFPTEVQVSLDESIDVNQFNKFKYNDFVKLKNNPSSI